jgi:hypothetical protein
MSGFGVGGQFSMSETVTLEASANYDSALFIRGITANSSTVDTIMIPSLEFKLDYDLVHHAPFTLGVSGWVDALAPASADSYQINTGYAIGGNLYLKEIRGHGTSTVLELGFANRNQNSSIASQTESEIILKMRFFFFGDTASSREGQ